MNKILRVLVVDDSEADAELAVEALRQGGYEVTCERVDTAEAMSAALTNNPWDVVLSDHRMPQFSATEALTLLKQKRQDLPFIILSGAIGEEVAVAAIKDGAHDYVTKSNLGRLVSVVERGLREAQARRERQRIERELLESEERYRVQFETSRDAILLLDQAVVFDCNRAALEMFGCPSKEKCLGRHPADFSPQHQADGTESKASAQKRIDAAYTTGTQFFEWLYQRSNGDLFPSEVLMSRFIVHGKPALQVVVRDVTERKRAEEALRDGNLCLQESLNQLEQAQQAMLEQERLSALGQMASGVAHDFNNALAVILGYSDLLLTRPELWETPGKAQSFLRFIHTSAQDAGEVVRRLREFSRKRDQHEPFIAVDLNRVIEQAIALTEPRWKDQPVDGSESIQVVADCGAIPMVAANESALREMLTNLIFNAVDAMPEGGVITLRTRGGQETVVLSVTDTGTGMSEDVRRRCLEPFFTTKGKKGTGLGLSMVLGIVTRHGGTIEIESAVGRGTTIWIRFPVFVTETPQAPAPGAVVPSSPLSILVVDDEPVLREFLAEVLHAEGHRVVTAADGREACEELARNCFSLVITDLVMPVMSGDKVAIAARQANAQTKVILLTGSQDVVERRGADLPCVDFIVNKPATSDTLFRAIAKVMADGSTA